MTKKGEVLQLLARDQRGDGFTLVFLPIVDVAFHIGIAVGVARKHHDDAFVILHQAGPL
jgi:hypothetical protein